jgi:hypothetical protein
MLFALPTYRPRDAEHTVLQVFIRDPAALDKLEDLEVRFLVASIRIALRLGGLAAMAILGLQLLRAMWQ